MTASLFASIVLAPAALDYGALIGLRAADGSVRTVLVSQRGVAYLHREHEGELLRSMKEAVHPFRTDDRGLWYAQRRYPLEGKFRIGWAGATYIGVEFDASRAGDAPFTRVRRRTYHMGDVSQPTQLELSKELNPSRKPLLTEAVEKARRAHGDLQASADEADWGYVRFEGKWQFVGALVTGDARTEFVVPGSLITSNPPFDNGEVSWLTVTRRYPDAKDIVSSRTAPFAVVVTARNLYVHEVGRTSLGRLVRRIPCKDATVVCFEFSTGSVLDAWLRYIEG